MIVRFCVKQMIIVLINTFIFRSRSENLKTKWFRWAYKLFSIWGYGMDSWPLGNDLSLCKSFTTWPKTYSQREDSYVFLYHSIISEVQQLEGTRYNTRYPIHSASRSAASKSVTVIPHPNRYLVKLPNVGGVSYRSLLQKHTLNGSFMLVYPWYTAGNYVENSVGERLGIGISTHKM